jgi:DNA-binding CsgD family transcriptional regulator
MKSIAIIILSLAILALIFYFADFKFELKFNKAIPNDNIEEDKTVLDKLSNSELNILKLISEGKTNQEIADILFISVHTVKKHISNIFKKLNLKSRAETRKYKNLINNI